MHTQSSESQRREATDDEVRELRHVVDSIPLPVWIALVASAAERFTFYAVSTPWQNYLQNDRDSIAVPGALGLGQATATNITSAFYFFSMLAPMPFAVLSDAWLGRYKTLCLSLFLNFLGCLTLFVTSLPAVTKDSMKIIGLALAMVLLGLGTGGVKATISPFIGDQYTTMEPQLVIKKTGERVIADRTLSLQFIYNVFFWFTNIASLSLVASTYLEKYIGFWGAYLLPLCSIWILIPLLLIWHKSLIKISPKGNVLPQAGKVIKCSIQGRFRLDAAKPTFQAERYGRQVEWDDVFVWEIRRGLYACKVMACFVPFHLCMNQMSNNLVSQAGQMRLSGIPNDTIQVLNSIACILLGPVVQKALYPSLRRIGLRFGPIARMTTAFFTMSAAMAFAAVVQKLIYTRGPCYEYPLACPGSEISSLPNDISVWVQTPVYFLLSLAEILGFATLSEYAYSEAPQNMRSLVQALSQVSSAIGSALGMAVSPASVDPKILYLYTGLAVAMLVTAPIFGVAFRSQDNTDQQNHFASTQPSHNDVTEEEKNSTHP